MKESDVQRCASWVDVGKLGSGNRTLIMKFCGCRKYVPLSVSSTEPCMGQWQLRLGEPTVSSLEILDEQWY